MNQYSVLHPRSLEGVDKIAHPHNVVDVDLDSPALEVLTDFEQHQPLLLEQNVLIDEARVFMDKTHLRYILVIDREERFRGVISLADLLSVKVMRAAGSTGLPRRELTIAHVMTRKQDLKAISLDELKHLAVGDLLATMRSMGYSHLLVVDGEPASVRGIVSSSEIARRLHVPVQIFERANSFSEICSAVRA